MENNNCKSGFATLIGRPNVGKSTLMNKLIGQKIAITSNKPQTTRNRIQTVYTCDEGQIVFLDTPGIHKPRTALGDYMVKTANGSIGEADAILLVIEPVRMPDCNIINTFAEGVQLAKTVGLDNVKVLIDFYHMVCEKETPEVLRKYGKEYLRHVHFSYPSIPEIDGVRDPDNIRTIFEGELHRRGWWRTFPSCREEWDYTDFIQALKDCGYQGRVSLEAPVTDFDRQAQEALAFMKAEF